MSAITDAQSAYAAAAAAVTAELPTLLALENTRTSLVSTYFSNPSPAAKAAIDAQDAAIAAERTTRNGLQATLAVAATNLQLALSAAHAPGPSSTPANPQI